MDMKTAWLKDHAVFSRGLVLLAGLAALVELVRLVLLAGLDYFTSAPVAL